MPARKEKRPSDSARYPGDPEIDALFSGELGKGNEAPEVLAFDQVCAKAKQEFDECERIIDNPTGSFDEALFGMLLRKLRIDNGYKTADDLSKALAAATGVGITPQTIYRIEKGTRSLTYPEFLAYSLLFFEEFDSDEMKRYRGLCVPKFWEAIDRRTYWDRVTCQL
ncbi:MAG: helix-turn-helix transcriptional regulator [Enterorhabdus sp.]|nr:helix-turn-helix transcriptional regulator [Enterorhabdus sp.]MCI9672880.1 helix-turn-helix transcriptional regulator [Enterorhabdus sp.]